MTETAPAVDLRFDLRGDGGDWVVVAVQRRYHCDADVATEACP